MPDQSSPRPRATALSYEAGRTPPGSRPTGAGLVAERIVAAAVEAGVPVRADPALTEALAAVALGAEVPEPMWRAVAEALAWA